MQKRRIGTFSMAIVLIAFGVVLIIAQINQISAINISVKFWPVVLIMLGGEILWYSYRHKGDMIIKYDIFSMFIIVLIIIVSLGIYGLSEIDAITKINTMISSQNYTFKIPYKEIDIPDNIEKIVIDAPNYCELNLQTENNNKLISTGTVKIEADSKEKAQELMNREYIITHNSSNTLFISIEGKVFGNDTTYSINPYEFTFVIPKNKKVEINNGSNLNLKLDKIENDWIIDDASNVNIRLDKNSNANINALVHSKYDLNGNVKWNITEDVREESDYTNIKGEIISENGQHTIYLLHCNQVTVDELK